MPPWWPGNSAAANEDALIYDVMAAFYTACGSFIGQNYGARQKDRVRRSYLISMAYSFGIGTAMGLAILAVGHPSCPCLRRTRQWWMRV